MRMHMYNMRMCLFFVPRLRRRPFAGRRDERVGVHELRALAA